MASSNKRTIESQTESAPEEVKADNPVREEPKQTESVYTVETLAKAHASFETSYAIVATALKVAGKEKATFKEAKEIVENFKNKEVK